MWSAEKSACSKCSIASSKIQVGVKVQWQLVLRRECSMRKNAKLLSLWDRLELDSLIRVYSSCVMWMLSGDYNQSALMTKVGLQQVSLMVTGLHIRQLLQRFHDWKGLLWTCWMVSIHWRKGGLRNVRWRSVLSIRWNYQNLAKAVCRTWASAPSPWWVITWPRSLPCPSCIVVASKWHPYFGHVVGNSWIWPYALMSCVCFCNFLAFVILWYIYIYIDMYRYMHSRRPAGFVGHCYGTGEISTSLIVSDVCKGLGGKAAAGLPVGCVFAHSWKQFKKKTRDWSFKLVSRQSEIHCWKFRVLVHEVV